MAATVKIKSLPALMFAQDYHEFQDTDLQLKKIGLSLRVQEICFDFHNGRYVGIVFSGRYPSQKKVAALLKKHAVKAEEIF